MAGYEIGISGLQAAQKALDIIGNNIANAATEGYHRQEIDLRSADEMYTNGLMVGQGVEMAGVKRQIDQVLEDEILRHESVRSQLERELETLKMMESAFGELSTDGLSTAIDEFFTAFSELAMRPQDVSLQSGVLAKAEALSNQFRTLDTVISNMEDMMFAEAQTTADRVNYLAQQIAELNKEIYTQRMRGYDSNNTMDQRDQLISELAGLIGVRKVERDTGMVDITASGISLVVGAVASGIEIGLIPNEADGTFQIGIRPHDTTEYDTEVTGGTLGAVFTLRNESIQEISDSLDLLASTFISEVNHLHVQGVGLEGSFTSLTGWTMSELDVADMEPPVTNGEIVIRVTDSAGDVQRYTITVTTASTLSSVAADIAAIPGLSNTSVNGDRFQIIADNGYTFDFLPGPLAEPSATVPSPLAGAGAAASEAPPAITVSGVYIGSIDETYTCTVSTVPPGQTYAIGNGTMELEIQNSAGSVIKTVTIGEGYSPGTTIIVEDGIKIQLNTNGTSPGYLNDGEQFEIEIISNSDTSGFLSTVGINTFFSGSDAKSIGVSEFVSQNGRNLAVSRSVEMTDNANAVAMGQLGDTSLSSITGLTPKEYYRQLAIGLGNQISMTDIQYENEDAVMKGLEEQRDSVSGVDVNDQASLMMLYERMFQAMARYINVIDETYQTVLTILQ